MDWDDLRFFLAVARTGKIIEAGRRLGVDQATVGRHIARLERQLKAELFLKRPTGYELTPDGLKLVTLAEDMERRAAEVGQIFGNETKTLSGPVRIGAPEGVASHLISRAATDLSGAHPDLEVQIVAMPRVFSLSKREVDFAIALSYPSTGRLKVRKIADYALHLYAAPEYLERHPVRAKRDIAACRGISYVQDLIFDRELDYIPLVSPDLKPALTSTSLWVQLEWTLHGAGLCVLPDFIARHHPRLIPVLPDEVHIERTFWLLAHEDNIRLERIAHCAEAVTATLTRHLRAQGNS
jgi:DNA-binding transcriptional LysR family regulator